MGKSTCPARSPRVHRGTMLARWVHACHPITEGVEAGELSRVYGALDYETLPQKRKEEKRLGQKKNLTFRCGQLLSWGTG